MVGMASGQNPAPNADIFDSYFRRADLDGDGRIGGLEALTFFQASGLPRRVLAKIWNYADKNQNGFLSRAEFYNALKLVTVAQSKRELTPEIVKAALFGPATAKLPPPEMNFAALGQSDLAASPATMSASSSQPTQGIPIPGFSGAGMTSRQNPEPNADLFDSYFRRADLDGDGRISGLEARTFFLASGLPKSVLAEIWNYADPNLNGFLSREEFYNALKLVTVAQSKRELTPENVKAALFGPAAAKIPPPHINFAALGQSDLDASPATMSSASSSSSQPTQGIPIPGFSGPAVSYEYDVFLSFRGDDTRESFTGTLYHTLSRVHKVKTFMDVIFRKGSKLGELLTMIEKSRMSIVVYSENFAESEWCLKELVKILEECDQRGHEVLPVFYKVNPSELRHQNSGKTKQHMDKHINTYGNDSDTVKSWSNAIKELGNSSGYTYWSGRGKQEVELAEEIAQEILTRLHC